MPGGMPVWYQPDPTHPQGYVLPFHLDSAANSAPRSAELSHAWHAQHDSGMAASHGRLAARAPRRRRDPDGPLTMGYHTRADLPFHYALADAYTICDAYYCSVLGPTGPNRMQPWTGMIDPAGSTAAR